MGNEYLKNEAKMEKEREGNLPCGSTVAIYIG